MEDSSRIYMTLNSLVLLSFRWQVLLALTTLVTSFNHCGERIKVRQSVTNVFKLFRHAVFHPSFHRNYISHLLIYISYNVSLFTPTGCDKYETSQKLQNYRRSIAFQTKNYSEGLVRRLVTNLQWSHKVTSPLSDRVLQCAHRTPAANKSTLCIPGVIGDGDAGGVPAVDVLTPTSERIESM